MPTKTLRLLGFALAALAQLAPAGDIPAELNGKLVVLQGKSVLPRATSDWLQTKYVALYFSAGWCGPCHQFTPELVKFYNEMKPKYPGFEVVFMSLDRGSNAMEKYMNEMAMPWPALRYGALRGSPLVKYGGLGIPDLVVLNAQGEVLSDSYAGKEYLGPYKVMNDLRKLLSGGSASVAPGNTAPAVAAANEPAKPASKSPSGTNWDEVFKKKSP